MSFPQIYQNADMLTPAAEKGTGVLADPKSDPPTNFGDMLNPDEKFKPKKMSAVRRAGIRKSAEYRSLPPEMAEVYIARFEKEAALAASAGKLLSGLKGKASGLFTGLKTKIMGTPKPTPKFDKAPAVIPPVRHQRMEHMQSGQYKEDPIYKGLLGQEQTGLEKFYHKYKTPIDIAPWLALPLASQAAGLGPIGDIAAFGGAMALPGMMGRKFGGGGIRAKETYLQGSRARV